MLPAARVVSLLLALASGSARAAVPSDDTEATEVDDDPYGRYFGAFWGLELRGGVAFRDEDPELDPMIPIGVGLRAATLLSLVDAELGIETVGFTRPAGPPDDRTDHELRRTTFFGDLRLHPLFMRALEGSYGHRVLAAAYLSLGGAAELLYVGGKLQDETHVGFGLRIGAGTELPLTDPGAATWSMWLGLGWRWTLVGFGDAPPGLGDMDQHAILLSLSFRIHDVDFARIPKPGELNDD